jgi:hypothetical protein
LLYRVLQEDPDLGRLDPELRALVAACMAKNPAQRPTPEQVRRGLESSRQTVQLGGAGWLPPAISASVGRLAVELLDLDSEPGVVATAATNPLPAQGYATPVHQAPLQTFAPPASPSPPTAIATMTGAMAPSWQTAPPPPVPPKRRGPLIALAAGAVVVVAGVAIAISTSSSSDKTSQQSSGGIQTQGSQHAPSASHAQTGKPSSTAADSAIPSGYLGSWQGTATGGGLPRPLAIAVTVVPGRPGDQVGTVINDGGDGQLCRINTSLVSADTARMVLRVIPNTVSAGCVPIMTDQIYTLNQDGTMQLSLGAYLAELSRQ